MTGWKDRQRRNFVSRSWATRDGAPWTEDEDEFLVEFWIHVEPRDRDEVVVSQALERTIESCRVRCEKIREWRGWKMKSNQPAASPRGWLVGFCYTCGSSGDVYSDGMVARCEECIR